MPAHKKKPIGASTIIQFSPTMHDCEMLESVERVISESQGLSRLEVSNADILRYCVRAGYERVQHGKRK